MNILDPLLMNAFNNVNMAASCIITSVSFATELGIPEDKWIYPLGGAGMREKDNCMLPTPIFLRWLEMWK